MIKLKKIPENTIVHTPTWEEAKELLQMLHEHGYRWKDEESLAQNTHWNEEEEATCYRINDFKKVDICSMEVVLLRNYPAIALSKFKEKYCELDLSELLRVHDCTIYSVVHNADAEFKLTDNCIELMDVEYNSDGSMSDVSGRCLLYPSRELFEKYPLDAKRAWMEWQENHRYWLSVGVWIDDPEIDTDMAYDSSNVYFNTPSDRDKCIEEIKAIIEKYSKK